MSNPAVLMLTDLKTKSGGRFKVEDNIGEAIHIHYDCFRLDLTISEFLEFCDLIEHSLKTYFEDSTFDINNFDPLFLSQISSFLVDLENVVFEDIYLKELIVSSEGLFKIPSWSKINKSRVYKSLTGDTKENDRYKQDNFFGFTNHDRVKSVKDIIDNHGYPFNNQYIVLFNNQNYIRDGQHRASSLYLKKGNVKIPVLRLYFKNQKYNLRGSRWLRSIFPILKIKLKNFLRKIKRRLLK